MYKIVIVDDEIKIADGIRLHFPWTELGFEIVNCFSSSLLALDYICDNPVDVVLTDIKMPILDGIELTQKVKERKPNVTVVVISGFRDFEYAKKAISLGVEEYITKPIDKDEIIETFKRIYSLLNANHPPKIETESSSQESSPLYYEQIIAIVISYVNDNIANATLDGASLKTGLSSGYLSKLFKQKTNTNFSDYLIATKMKKAAALLDDISLKSYDISYEVGYYNPKNFSRAFKQYYGISPREYREKGLSNET